MKKIFIFLLFFIFISGTCSSQWDFVGTLNSPGIIKRISTVDSNIVWACGGTKVWRTVNGGLNWSVVNTSGMNNLFFAIYAFDSLAAILGDAGSNGYTGGNANIFKTTNGGINWILIDSTGGDYGWISDITFAKTNPELGIAISDPPNGPGTSYYLAKSTDGGITWIKDSIPGVYDTFTLGGGLFYVDQSFYGFLIIKSNYIDSTRIYFTTNGGTSWNIRGTTPDYGTGIAGYCDFNNDKNTGIFVVATMMPKIARTTNGGLNWNLISTGLQGSGNSVLKWIAGSNIVFLTIQNTSTGKSVYRSNDNGLTWTPQNTPLNMQYTYDASFKRYDNKIIGYAITSYGNVFKTIQDTMPIGIQPVSNHIPHKFELYQNYPNPFNPSTKIRFDLSKVSNVKLIVYDALGREVSVLVDESAGEGLNAGTYEVIWAASNHPSGVYFYKLEAKGFSDSKKMLLVK